ncbi:MAG: nucleoside 2-deoxyribosyltransferase [Candidatus Nomurabacteria bacterium]|nr:nucleoside 2-deoxyribosyltransferase [Candidatus Nomurabacteria bacterium]
MKKGILVTIMGINNVGKTTQMNLLEKMFIEKGLKFQPLKYPIYKLEPTGPRIFACLKEGNPEGLTPIVLQTLCAENRKDFEQQMQELLLENDVVVAEMYTGTGIAYGMCEGVSKEYLLEANEGILVPDVSILLDGKRFLESVEAGHRFENDDVKSEFARQVHLELAKDLNWKVIDANQTIEEVHQQIWNEISKHLFPHPKIYFAGSIRGGRDDKDIYAEIISLLKKYGPVLSEHIGDKNLSSQGQTSMTNKEIYQKDVNWINESDIIIAEVTNPSLGVGYELGLAESLKKKIIALYRVVDGKRLSAMVAGNSNITCIEYTEVSELDKIFEEMFK